MPILRRIRATFNIIWSFYQILVNLTGFLSISQVSYLLNLRARRRRDRSAGMDYMWPMITNGRARQYIHSVTPWSFRAGLGSERRPPTAKPIGKAGAKPPAFSRGFCGRRGPFRPHKSTISGPEALWRILKRWDPCEILQGSGPTIRKTH